MVDFIRQNPAIAGFQKATAFQQQTESNDLTNQYNRDSMGSRLKQVAGAANTADAQGQVAQATIKDNIAQERTATAQGQASLAGTNLLNIDREMDLTTEMAKRYEAGNTAEGDAYARQLGKDPNDPGIQAIKQNRQYAGYIARVTEEAKRRHAGRPDEAQRYVEGELKRAAQDPSVLSQPGAERVMQPGAPAPDTYSTGQRHATPPTMEDVLRIGDSNANAEIKARFSEFDPPTQEQIDEIRERHRRDVQRQLGVGLPHNSFPAALQGAGSRLSTTGANPTSAQPPTASQAATGAPIKVRSGAEAVNHPAGTKVELPNGTPAVRVNSAAEVQALPPGTWFIGPDGQPMQRK